VVMQCIDTEKANHYPPVPGGEKKKYNETKNEDLSSERRISLCCFVGD